MKFEELALHAAHYRVTMRRSIDLECQRTPPAVLFTNAAYPHNIFYPKSFDIYARYLARPVYPASLAPNAC